MIGTINGSVTATFLLGKTHLEKKKGLVRPCGGHNSVAAGSGQQKCGAMRERIARADGPPLLEDRPVRGCRARCG